MLTENSKKVITTMMLNMSDNCEIILIQITE